MKAKRRLAILLLLVVMIVAGALFLTSNRQDKLYTVTVLPTLGANSRCLAPLTIIVKS